jgi:hypothetical protein
VCTIKTNVNKKEFYCSKTLLQDFCTQCDTTVSPYADVFAGMQSAAAAIDPLTVCSSMIDKYQLVGVLSYRVTTHS